MGGRFTQTTVMTTSVCKDMKAKASWSWRTEVAVSAGHCCVGGATMAQWLDLPPRARGVSNRSKGQHMVLKSGFE